MNGDKIRLAYELVTPLAAGAGMVIGLLAGLGNLVVSLVVGGIAGLIAESTKKSSLA